MQSTGFGLLLLFIGSMSHATSIALVTHASHDHTRVDLASRVDRWGYHLSGVASEEALHLYEEAVLSYAGLRGQLIGPLNDAITESPPFLMAHLYLASVFLVSTSATRAEPTVQQSFRAAKDLVKQGVGTPRELLYLGALEHGLMQGDFRRAAERWEQILADYPRDVLAARLSHDAYIVLGDTKEIRTSTARILGRWMWEGPMEAKAPRGMGDVKLIEAMWSFVLVEADNLHWAAEVARNVLERDPADVTALHGLSHTYEMQSRAEEGLAAFAEYDGQWEGDEDMLRSHVAWHRALMHVQLGQYAQALELYDNYIVRQNRQNASDLAGPATALGMTDASSLLWRLWLKGADVGNRWQTLRPFLAPYEPAHVTSFNDMHVAMGLAHADLPAAHKHLESMRRFIQEGLPPVPELSDIFNASTTDATNQVVLANAGLATSEAILAFVMGDYREAVDKLSSCSQHWQTIGGSNAQRDVLSITLIEAAVRNDTDLHLAKLLLGERAALKDPYNQDDTQERLKVVLGRRLKSRGQRHEEVCAV